ncbi:Acg family FMN-binding oxidoreductase [Nocardia spumae]|uniref:Acg family FMN-binding oxidoreductase n=1 Tax=Nocardia spumae TaxID=2887190 RepID=UPI001D15C59C|nr:nitroreductase family protein [Nocardia spumae]
MSTVANQPDHDTLMTVVALAVLAPSVHNSQPWLWRIGDETVQLYADPDRQLCHTDPDQRDLVVSCGAALHHLQVAAAALGWATVVHRLPNPVEPNHLAAVQFRPAPPTAKAVRLARAIIDRRSDRRRYTSWDVPGIHVDALVDAGATRGVLVRDIGPETGRVHLSRAFARAAAIHAADAGYRAELARWSGHHAVADGIPARNAVVTAGPRARPFADPRLPEAIVGDADGADRMLILYTAGDERISWLRSGEATSAILLAATVFGLATCPLSDPLEVPEVRRELRTELLQDSGFPQMIIRTGWAATNSGPLPATPRRPLDEVVASW